MIFYLDFNRNFIIVIILLHDLIINYCIYDKNYLFSNFNILKEDNYIIELDINTFIYSNNEKLIVIIRDKKVQKNLNILIIILENVKYR